MKVFAAAEKISTWRVRFHIYLFLLVDEDDDIG